jgi:hypothetical protein
MHELAKSPTCSGFTPAMIGAIIGHGPPADMRAQGVRELLIYCADYRCSHSLAINGDRWPDDVRLSDLEPRFICAACGKRGADVRPDFNWNRAATAMMGYR